jgi:ATP-dependent helicase/nuclease subunit A
LQWTIHDDARLLAKRAGLPVTNPAEGVQKDDPLVWEKLSQSLAWEYPFEDATNTPAKASVTALRRRAGEWLVDEETPGKSQRPKAKVQRTDEPAQVGTAHHKFLQLVSLDQVETQEALEREAGRLQAEKTLTPEEIQVLDFPGLAAFWQSDLGRQVRSQAKYVRRELVFTARFSPAELAVVTGEKIGRGLSEEFIVVQGVADLAVILPAEVWLLDFKTDQPGPNQLDARVEEYQRQLQLYALALSRVYRRPVTMSWLYFLALRRAVAVQSIAL